MVINVFILKNIFSNIKGVKSISKYYEFSMFMTYILTTKQFMFGILFDKLVIKQLIFFIPKIRPSRSNSINSL